MGQDDWRDGVLLWAGALGVDVLCLAGFAALAFARHRWLLKTWRIWRATWRTPRTRRSWASMRSLSALLAASCIIVFAAAAFVLLPVLSIQVVNSEAEYLAAIRQPARSDPAIDAVSNAIRSQGDAIKGLTPSLDAIARASAGQTTRPGPPPVPDPAIAQAANAIEDQSKAISELAKSLGANGGAVAPDPATVQAAKAIEKQSDAVTALAASLTGLTQSVQRRTEPPPSGRLSEPFPERPSWLEAGVQWAAIAAGLFFVFARDQLGIVLWPLIRHFVRPFLPKARSRTSG